jgi:S1-C subfamily serine protease
MCAKAQRPCVSLMPVAPHPRRYWIALLALLFSLVSPLASAGGRLGIAVDKVPDITAGAHSLPPNTGAHVASVVEGGPADRAGLRQGDIILRINERPIRGPDDVAAVAETLTPGKEVPVDILRYGNEMQLYVLPSL